MEYNVRVIGFHDAVDTAGVPHGADERLQVQVRAVVPQFLLDGVGVVLVNVENNQRLGLGPGDLAAQFAADASAATGDQHHFPGDVRKNFFIIDLHLFPAQQVRDLHVPELADADFFIEQLVHSGDDLQLAVGFLAQVQDGLLVLGVAGGNCEDDVGNAVLLGHVHNVVPVAHNFHAFQVLALLVGVVVNDAADLAGNAVRVLQFPDKGHARRTGADDHDPLLNFLVLLVGKLPLNHQKPIGEPDSGAHTEVDEDAHEVAGPGQCRGLDNNDVQQRRRTQHHVGLDDAPKLCQACIGPDALVEVEDVEHHHGGYAPYGDGVEITHQIGLVHGGVPEIKPQQQCKKIRRNYAENVQYPQNPRFQSIHRCLRFYSRQILIHFIASHLRPMAAELC